MTDHYYGSHKPTDINKVNWKLSYLTHTWSTNVAELSKNYLTQKKRPLTSSRFLMMLIEFFKIQYLYYTII